MTVKTFVYIATSLDGFIARKNGELDWLKSDNDEENNEDYGYQEFMDSMDVLVMGRNTYEKVLTFGEWPYANKRVVVLSSSSPEIPDKLSAKIEVLSFSPIELVRYLSSQGAKHLYIDGGDTIQRFLRAGLINEMIITKVPILIGDGIPLFGVLEKDIKCQHIETKQFDSGLVQSKYRIVHAA